jgi:DNA polymerase-1
VAESYRESEGRKLLQRLYEYEGELAIACDTETSGLLVADGRSKCIGVSIASVIDGEPVSHYFAIDHPAGGNVDPFTVSMLGYILEHRDDVTFIWANVQFDVLSLETIGIHTGHRPFYDIMTMAMLVDENRPFQKSLDQLALHYLGETGKASTPELDKEKKTGWPTTTAEQMWEYACVDAESTWRVCAELMQHPEWRLLPPEVWESKQQLIRILTEMRRRGVRIDIELADSMGKRGREEMAARIKELGMNPGSNKAMKKLFIEDLGLPILKVSKKTNEPSFDKTVMPDYEVMLERLNSPVATLVKEYRGWMKATTASYEPYVKLVSPDGRLRGTYNTHRTVSGRLSSSEPNLQQIPKESDKPWNGRVKECFIFTEMAKQLGMTRPDTKVLVYTIQYGGGKDRIMTVFGVDERTAIKIIDNFYDTYPAFRVLRDVVTTKAKREKRVKLWNGRFRHFMYGNESYKALNAIMQGGAADIVEGVMIRAFEELDSEDCRLLLQVHDSLVWEIRDDLVEEYSAKIKALMEDVQPAIFPVRFNVDAKRLRPADVELAA